MATQQSWPSNETAAVEKLAINRILCPFDFSEFSFTALRYAISMARHFDAKLYVRHYAEIPPSMLVAGGEANVISDWRSQLPQVKQDLEKAVKEAGVQLNEAELGVNEGPVLDSIIHMINHEKIDLTVMGTHGHKGFRRMMLGSIAEGVIHHAGSPVLVVSRPENEFVHPERVFPVELKTILFASDFSHRSDRALAYALKWACEWASKLILLHTVPKLPAGTTGMLDLFPEYNPYFERQIATAWDEIRGIVPNSVQQWCEVSYEVRHGDPKDEIIRVAEEKKADLVVVGARGAGGSQALWGSVSSAVVRSGRFPSLVVRE